MSDWSVLGYNFPGDAITVERTRRQQPIPIVLMSLNVPGGSEYPEFFGVSVFVNLLSCTLGAVGPLHVEVQQRD